MLFSEQKAGYCAWRKTSPVRPQKGTVFEFTHVHVQQVVCSLLHLMSVTPPQCRGCVLKATLLPPCCPAVGGCGLAIARSNGSGDGAFSIRTPRSKIAVSGCDCMLTCSAAQNPAGWVVACRDKTHDNTPHQPEKTEDNECIPCLSFHASRSW